MPKSKVLSADAVGRLPPMLFGRIRWNKGMGSPVGDPASGFKVLVEEHTATQFRMGESGPEAVPGTGIWKTTTPAAPCWTAPDEGNMHVVRFSVPDVHLNAFPDGKYRIAAELTGNWSQTRIQVMLGYKRIEPLAFYVTLTKERHIVSVDFEVVQHAWSLQMVG